MMSEDVGADTLADPGAVGHRRDDARDLAHAQPEGVFLDGNPRALSSRNIW